MSSLFNQNRASDGVFFIEDRIANNEVKLSVLADIGSSSFVYDMHNIKEVFIFPKIWYRRSLARRLFFGDETIPAYQNTDPTAANLSSESKSSSMADINDLKRRNKTLFLQLYSCKHLINHLNIQ